MAHVNAFQLNILCPAPLVISAKDDYFVWPVYGNCSVPCPTIEYTSSEWDTLSNTLIAFSVLSMVSSFLSLATHAIKFRKFYIQCMFISGFFFNSVVTTIFFISNRNNDVVCDGPANFIEKGGLCIFQAASLIFCFIWVETWSVIFVVDMYLHVTCQATVQDIPRLRYKYTFIAIFFALLATIPPLVADNVGFDPEANVPLCLYMLSENITYFWYTFFLPLCILIVLAIIFAILSTVRLNQVFGESALVTTGTHPTGGVARYAVQEEDEEEESVGVPYPRPGNLLSQGMGGSLQDADILAHGDIDYSILHQKQTHTPSAMSQPQALPQSQPRDGRTPPMSDSIYSQDFRTSLLSAPGDPTDDAEDDMQADPLSAPEDGELSGNSNSYSVLSSVSGIFSYNHGTSYSGTSMQASGAAARGSGASSGLYTNLLYSRTSQSARNSQNSQTESRFFRFITYLFPSSWTNYLAKTWAYNGKPVFFVMFFCFSSVCVAPMLYHLFYTTWDDSVDAGEDFAGCLVKAAMITLDPRVGVPQTQEAVNAYARETCGEVPGHRPNQGMLYFILIWASGYGIIPSLIFGFAGMERVAYKYIQQYYKK